MNNDQLQFRRDKDSGAWKVFGPAAVFEEHLMGGIATFEINAKEDGTTDFVTVTKRDGSETIFEVSRLSKPFDIDGVAHLYGYGVN